jgi:4-amino-4-deoxy-L-arabinose transferase-like glycosyltransferase
MTKDYHTCPGGGFEGDILHSVMGNLRPRPLLWLTAAALLMVTIDLGRGVLSTNDEVRFAVLGQDILARGSWIFPELNGVIYHNKPPLLAWLVALTSWPVGHVTQLTAALPSALAGLGTALMIFGLGCRLFGAEAGWFAALAAISTQGFYMYARLPMPDMLLTLFITVALAMFWPMLRGRPGAWWMGFYGFTAAAFWAKGPAGLLPLAVALVCVLVCRRPGAWRDLRLPHGLALLLMITAPWWLPEALSGHAEVRKVVLVDYLWWYVPRNPGAAALAAPVQQIFGILFPWVLVVPAVLVQAVRVAREERGQEGAGILFLLLWATVLLVFVGISQQQRLRYYLPLVAPVSLLIGWWAATLTRRAPARGIPWRAYAVAGAVLAVVTAIFVAVRPEWFRKLDEIVPSSIGEVVAIAVALALMIAAVVYGMQRNRLAQAFGVAWVASAVLVAGSHHWQIERRNAAYDYARLRTEMRAQLHDPPLVATSGVQELPFVFYFGQRVVAARTAADVRRALAQNSGTVAILTDAAIADWGEQPRPTVLLRDRLASRSISVVGYAPGP